MKRLKRLKKLKSQNNKVFNKMIREWIKRAENSPFYF